MARPLPTAFEPLEPFRFAPGYEVRAGAAASAGELALVRNLHFAHGYQAPPVVNTVFNSDAGYLEGASTSHTVRGTWRRRVFRDLLRFRVVAYVSNTGAASPADDGEVQFRLTSDNAKNVVLAVPAATAAWTKVSGTFGYTPGIGGSRDTIELTVKNGTAGAVRVRSVQVWIEPLASVAAGVTTEGFVPLDDQETSQDDPLTVYLRQVELDDLEVLRKTRSDTVAGWSEDALVRSTYEAYAVAAAGYTIVRYDWFRTLPHQTHLEWALAGYRAGASGSVRLRTGYMIDNGVAGVEQALGATWTTPYSGAWYDDGGSTLQVYPNAANYLEVALKGDGASKAFLMALGVWVKDMTA